MLVAVHKHLVASVETFLLRALRLPRPRRSIIHDLAFLPTLSAPPRHEIERTVLYISCVIAGGAGGGERPTLITGFINWFKFSRAMTVNFGASDVEKKSKV